MKTQIYIISLILIIVSLVLPMALALTESDADYKIKQYSVFDLKIPCVYNGTFCSYTSECNITLLMSQGNGTIIFNNTQMTGQGGVHNITLSGADTKLTGWYKAFVTCTDLGDEGSDIFYLLITPTGDDNNTNTFIIIGLAFILIIAFGYIVQNEYIVFIGGLTASIAGVYGMVYGFGSTQTDFTRMLSLIIIGLGIIFIIQPAYSLIEKDGDTGYEEVEDISS